ncbi:MAG TPA: hypothetical protein VKA27_18435 [Sunxiuqinia sp.]|nr:hypothetical protein [Sunxiuqinia sp.]
MKKLIYLTLITLLFGGCSSGRKALERGDYLQAIEKAVTRLSNNPDNRKAKKVLKEGYPMAMDYYQEEIDQILSGNDQFKWEKTLDIMQRVNHLSELIRRVPAARKLIPSPKTYTSEIGDATQRAAEERYQAGLAGLKGKNREDAKQAYFNFQLATRLVPNYKDVDEKMAIAKERATLKVILEPIPLPSKRYELSAQFFYGEVIKKMKEKFPQQSFVNFYTPDEAEKNNLQYPDFVVSLEFYDFFVGRPNHYEKEETLSRVIQKKVKVQVSRDSVRYENRPQKLRGKIKIITDEVMSKGLLNVQVENYQTQDVVVNDQLPGQFVWRNQYGVFVGDEEVLTKEQIRILNNKAVPPPNPQDMFVEFTRPIFDQLAGKLLNYFSQYN